MDLFLLRSELQLFGPGPENCPDSKIAFTYVLWFLYTVFNNPFLLLGKYLLYNRGLQGKGLPRSIVCPGLSHTFLLKPQRS